MVYHPPGKKVPVRQWLLEAYIAVDSDFFVLPTLENITKFGLVVLGPATYGLG